MDHHHELVGLAFAIMGGNLVSSMSQQVLNTNKLLEERDDTVNRFDQFGLYEDLQSDKVYLCCAFAVVLGLIQLITSAFLIGKESFLKIWSIIHIVLAQCYIIMFIILIVKLDDDDVVSFDERFRLNRSRNRERTFDSYLCQGFLFITPVAVFNLIFKRGPGSGRAVQPVQQLPGAWPLQGQQINYGWDYQYQPGAGPFVPPVPVGYAQDFRNPPRTGPPLPPAAMAGQPLPPIQAD